jgi:CBS-domain-containing membrane protein
LGQVLTEAKVVLQTFKGHLDPVFHKSLSPGALVPVFHKSLVLVALDPVFHKSLSPGALVPVFHKSLVLVALDPVFHKCQLVLHNRLLGLD